MVDIEKIKALIELVEASNIVSLSVEVGDMKVEVKKEQLVSQSLVPQMVSPQVALPPTQVPAPPAPLPSESAEEGLVAITSPMVGTFYRASSPESPPYVEVGDSVSLGKVVCIVEAMKLFNEIESEVAGTIVKILAENAKPVEYGQTLMLVRPAGR